MENLNDGKMSGVVFDLPSGEKVIRLFSWDEKENCAVVEWTDLAGDVLESYIATSLEYQYNHDDFQDLKLGQMEE